MADRSAQQAMMARRYGRSRAEVVQEPAGEPEGAGSAYVTTDPEPTPEPAAEPAGLSLADLVADSTVDEVLAAVESGEWDVVEVYVAEEDGKGRVTLLRTLEDYREQRG